MPGKRRRASYERKGSINDPSLKRKDVSSVSNNAKENTTAESETQASTAANSTNNAGVNAASNVSPTTPSADENTASSENKGSTTFYGWLYKMTRRGRKYLVAQLGLVLPSIVLMLLGFKDLPRSVPLVNIIEQHPVGSPIVGGILLLLALIALIISFGPEPKDNGKAPNQSKDWRSRQWIIATVMSTTSFIVSSALLVIVLIRPPWCPSSFCPPPRVVIATNPQGAHDANLDTYFLTFQGSAIVIPGDPGHALADKISNQRSPGTVNAILLQKHQPSSLYRIVVMAQSLYQGRYSILLDQVALIVVDRPVIPRPLNVWVNNSLISYNVNRYEVVYNGEGPGTMLSARYLESPRGYTQLAPNEADQLDIEINSHVPVDLKFKIQVTYHIATETKRYMLRLPQVFEVVFADPSNWHQYQLQGEHFIAVR
jgi:hypothetical protein